MFCKRKLNNKQMTKKKEWRDIQQLSQKTSALLPKRHSSIRLFIYKRTGMAHKELGRFNWMRSLFIQWIRVTSTWLCIAQNIQLLPTHKLKIIQINRLSCESQFKLGPEPGQDLSPNGVLRRENASEKINTYLSPYEKQKVCVCVCLNIRKFHWQLISLSIITARLWILWYSWPTYLHTR